MTRTFAMLLVLSAVAAPSFAAASEPTAPRSATVRHADLNLTDPTDARVMLLRLREAAAEVCGRSTNGFSEIARYRACYQATMVQTVSRLNAPAVTAALHATAFREPEARRWAALKP